MGQDSDGTLAEITAFGGKIVTIPEAGHAVPRSDVSGRKRPGGAIVDWLLARKELAQAEADVGQLTTEQREFIRRAKVALEVGELAFAPGNAVRSGSSAPQAADVFRQAIYWALLSRRTRSEPIALEQLWAETERSVLQPVAGNEAEYAYLTIAMRATFHELWDGTDEAQRASAVQLRRAANRLVLSAQRPLWRVEWAKLKRAMRVAVAVLLPVLALVWLWPAKADLAKSAPWRASSVGTECHPEKSDCGGVKTDIFFHTRLEQDPWLEYDFGTPLSFSSLTVKNRSDFGPERAIPLVVEVSNDGKSFKEVIRRTDAFKTWSPSFTPQRARYLRLRVARESILHLESVQVHP
jgi:F5/8 type C domain-containing protein